MASMNRPVGLLIAFVLLAASAVTSLAQATITVFGIGKKHDFLQNSSASPTSHVIIGDPAGPYHFSANISGSSLNLLNPVPKVTTPLSAKYNLTGDTTDVEVVGNYSTKASLDAAFPNGSYSFSAGTYSSLPISFGASDGYPTDIPQITNGAWDAQGNLLVNPEGGTTLNFNNFSGYSTGNGGVVTLSVYAVSGNTVGGELMSVVNQYLGSGYNWSAAYNIPAGVLQPNQVYYGELSYTQIININASFINSSGVGPGGISAFANTTGFMISTFPPTVAPNITFQPLSQTVISGQNADFSVGVGGNPAPDYQWQRLPAGSSVWVNLLESGSYLWTTTNVLRVVAATVGMNGDQFRCIVTNSAGSANSSGATLTVNPVIPPTITQQPVSQVVAPGGTATFSVAATGTGTLTYRWNGVQRYGIGNGATLTIPGVQTDDLGVYSVTVTDALGTIGSQTVTLSFSPATGPGVVAVKAGRTDTLFIKSDGTLWGMGSNWSGQLGDGTFVDRGTPVLIASSVASASICYQHALFIKTDRTLWYTGTFGFGPLGNGTYSSTVPVQIATDVVSASAGETFSLFIKSDGTLWTWGRNLYEQLVNGVPAIPVPSGPVQIAEGVVAASAGRHSLFVKADGTLWAMGYNAYGQLGDGTTTYRNDPVQIATGVSSASAGINHSLFIKSDGTLWSMGYNSWGQLGDGTRQATRSTPVAVATGVVWAEPGDEYTLAVKSDNTLWGVGENASLQLGINGRRWEWLQLAAGVTAASAGGAHSTFITSAGTLKGMGGNSFRQIGEERMNSYFPLPVPIAEGVVAAPAVPIGGFASEATPQSILVNWNPTIGAIRYEVWRSTSNDSGTATRVGVNVPNPLYFDLTAAPGTQYFYWIKAANPAGTSGFSVSITGMIGGPPSFTTQPTSQIATLGASVSFTAIASGAPAPTLQWQKGGVNIPGATGSSYTVANVAAGDVGNYTVVATNSLSSTTSNVATLTLGTIPAGFDVQSYLTRYPDVAALYGANPYAAWQHYHDVGIYQGEVFDELFRVDEYLVLYPELFAIFGADLGGALDHWLSTGRIEGKLGRIPLEFSAQGYFDRNPDVATAVNNNPILAWGHYWLYGIYEGRGYDNELRVFEYLAINADLTAAFVNDWRTAALHWMRYGRTEGRLGRLPLTFSVATYLSRNPDVAAVWGTDPTTVFLHFWLYGVNEARTYDDLFRVDDYLALNPDVAATFGTDRRGAFKHWVRYGQAEGRPAKNP